MAEEKLRIMLDGLTEDTAPDAAADFVITKDTSASLLKKVKLNKIGGSAFGTVAVSGQSDVVADQINDTLTLVAGANVTITTTPGSDEVTIAASGGGSALIYSALIEQTGTGAPTVTVFENTLGGTVIWTRSSMGFYVGTLAGAFPIGNTHFLYGFDFNGSAYTVYLTPNGDDIRLSSYDNTSAPVDLDGGSVSVYVRVYP